jgi:hypothetical protein
MITPLPNLQHFQLVIIGTLDARDPTSVQMVSFAIDDVSIFPGACNGDRPEGYDTTCTFEDGFCSLTHVKSSGYPWMIGFGRTVSGRAPALVTDHTDPDSLGFYAYADLTSWNLTGQVVESNTESSLRSETLISGTYCLRLWYFLDPMLDVNPQKESRREGSLSRLEIVLVRAEREICYLQLHRKKTHVNLNDNSCQGEGFSRIIHAR